jgi:protein gp37
MTNISKTIGYAEYSWNPVVGCSHGCPYCYAKRLNDRFKFIPEWTKPEFFEKRLEQPSKLKKNSVVFVCDMADLFCKAVPKEWIRKIIDTCTINRQHRFIMLTKNPQRCYDFTYWQNTLVGQTITKGLGFYPKDYKHELDFLSIEPIMGSFEGIDLGGFDFIIVGAMTGADPVVPKREWIDSIQHPHIFYKNNIIKYFPDLKEKSIDINFIKGQYRI